MEIRLLHVTIKEDMLALQSNFKLSVSEIMERTGLAIFWQVRSETEQLSDLEKIPVPTGGCLPFGFVNFGARKRISSSAYCHFLETAT
jgi:hypothetical protein